MSLLNEEYFYSLIDEYGFKRDDNFDAASYERFYSAYLKTLIACEKKWNSYLKSNHSLRRNFRLKSLIRSGIPIGHRSYVWFTVSGALDHRNRHPNYFSMLLSTVENNKNVSRIIQADLPRTFPGNVT